MAQEIGFFQDNVVLTEGPFVISNPLSNGWRIEVVVPGRPIPQLPGSSIYKEKERLGMVGKTMDKAFAVAICDALNNMVKDGRIRFLTPGGWTVI